MRRITTTVLLAAALILPLSLISAPSASARVFVGISVGYAPPPLVWYTQPICSGYGYYWVPGYWGYGPYGYYWVPGAWVWPPRIGFLWTPGYWGWRTGYYWWHPGYWGPRVGFYGGINYGYGYTGRGYHGGYWRRGHFYYNRAVDHVNRAKIRYTYTRPVATAHKARRISYNGGRGGIALRPTAQERALAHERHIGLTAAQRQRLERARRDPALRFANNRGKPPAVTEHRPNRTFPALHRPQPAPDTLRPAGRPMRSVMAPHDRIRPAPPMERPRPYERPRPPAYTPVRPLRAPPVDRPMHPPRARVDPPRYEHPVRPPRIERRGPPERAPRLHRQHKTHRPPA